MSEPIIQSILVPCDHHGNPESWIVGQMGVTRIEQIAKDGEYACIPWVRVWCGDKPVAEFCEHKLAGIYFVDVMAHQEQQLGF